MDMFAESAEVINSRWRFMKGRNIGAVPLPTRRAAPAAMSLLKRKLIEWVPNRNGTVNSQFVLASSDLRLYELNMARRGDGDLKFSADGLQTELDREQTVFKQVAVCPDVQFARCIAWSPHRLGEDPIVAAGLQSGRVALASFKPPRILKEFVPRNPRACFAVAWNPHNSNQLVAGLDKVRMDYSTLVWDVTRTGSKAASATPSAPDVENITRPLSELANSEATCAVSWIPSQPNCLACGTGAKWVRIYDLRGDVTAPRSVVAHSKAVYGVAFDPYCDNRFATYSDSPDGVVKVWDLRMLTDPVFPLNTNSKCIIQVAWSPTRPGVLATISRDELVIKLWDMKENTQTSGLSLNAPCRTYPTTEALNYCSWHPTNEHRMLTVASSCLVHVATLQAPIAVTWDPVGSVYFASGKHLTIYDESHISAVDKPDMAPDIGSLMRQRVARGYSIDVSR